MCGRYVRNVRVRARSPLSAGVSINLDFTGACSHLRLPLFGVVRYNPAPLLGHMLGQMQGQMLGQRRRRWRGKSTG
jgi:hypothetical protein